MEKVEQKSIDIFNYLKWKKIINNTTWDLLSLNIKNIWNDMKLLTLEGTYKVADLYFKFRNWNYYIVQLNSYKRWNWGFILDLFLEQIWNNWVYLFDEARDNCTNERKKDFYLEHWFNRLNSCENIVYKNIIKSEVAEILIISKDESLIN